MPTPQPALTPDHNTYTTESLYKTVLKFSDRACLDALTQASRPSEASLSAMQQLTELIKQLRSLEPAWQSQTVPNWEELIPYVSDEAYEVLETLQEPRPEPIVTSSSTLVLLESLIPQFLWCVARSSYTTMQLIEGIPVNATPPDAEEMQGILRLVVLLEIQMPETVVSLDLTMGCTPPPPLNPNWVIQPAAESPINLNWQPFDQEEGSEPSSVWIHHQLGQFTRQLVATDPGLQPWLEGITVDCLAPTTTCWQAIHLQLQLDFAFSPYPRYTQPTHPLTANAPIDAELLEETEINPVETKAEHRDITYPSSPTTPVTVVEMPLPPLLATTIVRLAEAETLEKLATFAIRQELSHAIHSLQLRVSPSGPDFLPSIVQEAAQIANLTYHSASANFCLLQPELLIDELIPKLLWHLTRSSFTVMQWLGGLATGCLQPGSDWQTGILRLMVVLEFQILEEHWFIDLAVGRFVDADSWQVPSDAIVYLKETAPPNLIPVEQLQSQLQAMLQTQAPEIACLSEGVSVEFLTIDHDWQPGKLTLHTGLEFMPDLF